MWKAYQRWRRDVYADPAQGRYVRRLMLTMLVYIALLFGVQDLLPLDRMSGPALWIAAALPGIPIAAVFVLIGRYLVELRDEYRRVLGVRKAMIATGVTMTVASIWGFLELLADAPHLPTFYIPVIWFGSLGLGECVNAALEHRGTER